MGYHTTAITGYYTATGETACSRCVDTKPSIKKTAQPIFAGTETDDKQYCEWCGNEIVTTLS